jgi:hypothetical protein
MYRFFNASLEFIVVEDGTGSLTGIPMSSLSVEFFNNVYELLLIIFE